MRQRGGWRGSGCCGGGLQALRHVLSIPSPGVLRLAEPHPQNTAPHNPGAQQKSWGSSCLSDPPQAGLALAVGFVPPGAVCTPSHHPAGRAPHVSAALGATCWELLPANTCALYQLAIDLEKFMASASHDRFARNGSFPQMMSFMVIIYFNFFMIQEANGTGPCRSVKGQIMVLSCLGDIGRTLKG